eukprot:104780_1
MAVVFAPAIVITEVKSAEMYHEQTYVTSPSIASGVGDFDCEADYPKEDQTSEYLSMMTLSAYITEKMNRCAPNLAAFIWEMVGARRISHTDSLANLSMQLLGAENALFRVLKMRGNTSKYGMIFKSSFIQHVCANNKGEELQGARRMDMPAQDRRKGQFAQGDRRRHQSVVRGERRADYDALADRHGCIGKVQICHGGRYVSQEACPGEERQATLLVHLHIDSVEERRVVRCFYNKIRYFSVKK